jgi:hypothetical protein
MRLSPQQLSDREKLILTGLFLSKYDAGGVKRLGFTSFLEAFNVVGYALGAKPASIKNYRDEFDPLFPNRRKGWHKRPTRDYCRKVFEEYRELDLDAFTGLIQSFVGYDQNVWSEVQEKPRRKERESGFAQRLMTGLAAEHYFESLQPKLPEFRAFTLENMTRVGCGYDYRLHSPAEKYFLAVEVKGLAERNGSLSLTPKEYEAAGSLTDRFFLFVVKNFRETPFHEIYQNPVAGKLRFTRKERVQVSVSWLTTV